MAAPRGYRQRDANGVEYGLIQSEDMHNICVGIIRSDQSWSAKVLDQHFSCDGLIEPNEGEEQPLLKFDPNFLSPSTSGMSLLHMTACEGPASCVAVLLKHGARADIQLVPSAQTPLHYVALNGRFDEAVLLLKAGASPSAVDDNGDTPLVWAAEHGKPELVKLYLRHGASIDDITGDLDNPFDDGEPVPPVVVQQHAARMVDVRAIIDGVVAAGSYRKYELAARVPLLMLLELCTAGRAEPGKDCPKILRRLFSSQPATLGAAPRKGTGASILKHSTAVNALPKALFWEILAFWRNF